ncbi:MAG: lipocalin family protein [Flavobacteriia bacterium]|nr:lipocalin family protein [Flavobacteriia bacterium]
MKKVLAIIGISFLILTSCRPEVVINHKLEGEWNLTSLNDLPLPLNNSQSIIFDDCKGASGKLTYSTTENSISTVVSGIYSVYKSATITMAFSDDPNVDTRIFDIISSSKTELKIKQQAGTKDVYVFKKK